MPPYENIIIRMPNWLGDAVMATPILLDLRCHFPKANITAMCQGSNLSALLMANPNINEIFSFSKPNFLEPRNLHRDIVERLRQGQYDLGILLPNSLSSAWWFWRGHVERRIGFSRGLRRPFLTDAVRPPKTKSEEHQVISYKRLLAPLDIAISESEPTLYLTAAERLAASELLEQRQIPQTSTIIGINPGAAYGSAKCWPPEYFRALIQKLAKLPNTYILLFSDLAGAPLVHNICRGMPPQVVNLAAATHLRQLMALIEKCSVFLSNDSGPMHIAAALKRPLVALFGSTNPTATGPYKQGTVIYKKVSCSPCLKRTCPIDFKCMKQITVDEVYSALLSKLDI